MSELIKIPLKDKVVVLREIPFDGEIIVEDIVSIHYHNLFGDIVTFPVALNRIGNMKAEIEQIIREAEFELEFVTSELDEHKAVLEKQYFKALKESGINSPTLRQIEGEVLRDPSFKEKRELVRDKQLKLIALQGNQSKIENIYWSCKGKLDLLTKLADKLRPEEFENEILDETINGFAIKLLNKIGKS